MNVSLINGKMYSFVLLKGWKGWLLVQFLRENDSCAFVLLLFTILNLLNLL